ncbi:glycoside hydrolase family 25 protein [Sphingobacterium phlebotomi]|uniref:Glycoside hydrolase family 25 protein n=1 Tax=Sphingobacterium phlebotomi TaxID=2605433 RepID=A0A5D4GW81_9SPHI|nr:GH25 family lysozyme [Sphingobacterium phlebotomi]TYR32598.1 glycoside hydrolase family 25 protein [Sphingobacterium phlebotomi]
MTRYRKTVRRGTKVSDAERKKYLIWSVVLPLCILIGFALLYYRTDFSYTIKSWIFREESTDTHTASEHEKRNIKLMEKYDAYVYGVDISQYQGDISWIDVNTIYDQIPLDFVFIRATMGEKAKDKRFVVNWEAAQSRAKLRGAYHYFRPNENSIRQARNFISAVNLRPGDLPPVLDIEERPRKQPMDSLKVGLKRWLNEVEKHYGIQPILYSGDSYFTDFLEKEFSDYVLWIANYNFWVDKPKKHWDFWQFSERGYVRGIKGNVDLNMFKGNIEKLEELTIPY